MDPTPIIFFVIVLLLLLWGFPVAFTLGGASIVFGLIMFGLEFFNLLPLRVWGIMNNYILIAVPLFVFMGVMFEKSGLAEELLETMALLFGKLRGGLAISVLIVGTMLAAATGIVGATVVTMGVLTLPTMLKKGYDPKVATGIISASGTLGQIIPPSIVLVLLGSVLNVSVGDLFIAAVIPGFILVFMYLLWIIYVAITKPKSAPAMPKEDLKEFAGKGKAKKIIIAFVIPFLLIIVVLGSIFAGIASPTEAAGIGAIGATLLTIVRGKLNLPTLKAVMNSTTRLTSMAFMILVGASAFGLVFRGMGGDRYLTHLITTANLEPYHFIAIVMLIIFIAGFFIDFIEITFIIVPVVAPIFIELNIDLIWIGILIAINLQTSFLTPPFGFALFYLKGVAPDNVTTTHIYKGIIPYVIIQLLGLSLVVYYPDLALWLPKLLGKL
ncbi:MAG: TRAP transporter large permease subunit [Melioribacteraceae bacterium]|nr:TRAP transporter large permease subunit [Melioribacteraceae bacterium]MCF8354901.1 TRAP transporter large permease subunit [Melioribacteraceae bacterium]MCF8396042.1 TRAP transporter large permease subunit [Melioribacteraceae bacterium]MCF8421063.1 TRAP transporter large permease subunit [Melioribacteraceae bacterium]